MHMSSVGKLRLMNRERKMIRYYDDLGPGRGNCTMGIGHYVHKRPCIADELARTVTEKDVTDAFDADVLAAERAVDRNVTTALTQEQFDALVSHTFNRGANGARKVYQLINAGDFDGAAGEISSHHSVAKIKKKGKWVTVHASGLISRRAEESAPFRKSGSASK